jgi:flagellar motility protein MotE (MotC chaperone)
MTQPNDGSAKQTASKAPAMESNVKADTKRGKKEKKEKKGNTFLLIVIILILTSIISFGAIFMFNFAGLKAETSMWISNIPVVGKLLKPVVENKNPEQIAKEEIDREKSNLEIKRKELNDLEKELTKKEKELENKEKELADKELQINDTLLKLSDKLTSIQEQVEYLEKVDNTKAMNIIMSMDSKATAVQILRNMKKEKASAILAQMDPLQAAQILEDLAVPEMRETGEKVVQQQ